MSDRLLGLSPTKIAALYLGFGVLWIGTTDSLVFVLFDSPETVTFVQSVKGWVFVGLSALLVFGLSYTHTRQQRNTQHQLQTVSEQLQVLHRYIRHNLRNDLNVVLARMELAMDDTPERQGHESLETAMQTTEKIVHMSEKLRMVNAIDLDAESRRIDLATVVEDSVSRIRREYPGVNIAVDCPETIPIYGDAAVSQAVTEVMRNAVEHNPAPPGECEVSVSVESDDDVTLTVSDNGPSIPQYELAGLREESESDLVHTSGVGLWMVKWVCECHGGDLDIDVAEGTTVQLTFDRAPGGPLQWQVTETMGRVQEATA